MSDTEALMWRLERDPRLTSTFANVSILDRPPDVDRLRRRMERAALVVPRLRQVVRETGPAAPPTWVDDPEFDIDMHVRRIALPDPGTERQLLDLATLVTVDPFDRTRPLWQFTVVEGLDGGRAALIEKLHHTISDGEAGILLAMSFLDTERVTSTDPPPGPEPVPDDQDVVHEDAAAVAVREVLAGTLRLPLGIARRVQELLAAPEQLDAASGDAAETLDQLARQLAATGPACSPLWRRRSSHRHLEVATAPLSRTRAVASELGGTLNTAFLTIAAEAAGRYHTELGAPVDRLRASMAISTRTAGSGANAFSIVPVLVPTADMALEDRFRAIDAAAQLARRDGADLPVDTLAALATALPTAVVTRLARRQASSVDFATSNVRGTTDPMFVAGARILRNHPIGPLAGVPFNLTLLSYEDRLDIGINTDAAAVDHPALLRDAIVDAIARFTSS